MKTTAFIGTGRMAAALISCICKSSVSRNIIASDKNNINLARIKKQFKIKTTTASFISKAKISAAIL